MNIDATSSEDSEHTLPHTALSRRALLVTGAFALVGRMLFGSASEALAAKASDATLGALSGAQAEYEAAMAELSSITNELESASYELERCEAELAATDQAIADLEARITQHQAELAEAQGVLSDRIKATYCAGDSNLLDVLLGAKSFDDLVSRLYYATKVSDADTQAINEVKRLKAELEGEEQELQNQRAQQAQLLAEQQARTNELAAAEQRQQSYAAGLSSEVRALMAQAQAELMASQQAEYEEYLARQQQEAAASGSGDTSSAGGEDPGIGSGSSGGESGGSGGNSRAGESAGWQPPSGGGSTGGGLGRHVSAAADVVWDYIGIPYEWAGTSRDGLDCSGLVYLVYQQLGYSIPRSTYALIDQIQSLGQMVYSLDELQPGDLWFPHSGHVGIYLGGGMMIHAPRDGEVVQCAPVYAFMCGGCPV